MKLVVLLIAACVTAFGAGDWATIRAMRPGRAVTIHKDGGSKLKGDFVAATDDAVTVHAKRQDVSREMVGLTLGAAGGAAAGAGLEARVSNEVDYKGPAAAGMAVIGAVLGFGIGALADIGHKTVYER